MHKGTIEFRNHTYIFRCAYNERHIARKAGFRFSAKNKFWYTTENRVAIRLRKYFDKSAESEMKRILIERKPWTGELLYPKGKKLKPGQEEAARFALSQTRSYIEGKPGTGKTIIAALIHNSDPRPTIYICPASLARSVEDKLNDWMPNEWVDRIDTKKMKINKATEFLIVPDSLIHKPEIRELIMEVFYQGRVGRTAARLFVDEAHRFKTHNSTRTEVLLGEWGFARSFIHQVYLSGTPMPNARPWELYPILNCVAPETIDFMTPEQYGEKYCGAFFDGRAMNYDGATNLDEFKKRMKSFMYLLPKKRQGYEREDEIVILGKLPPKVQKLDDRISHNLSIEEIIKGGIARSENISTYRKEVGKLKVKPAIDFIKTALEDSNDPMIVFAHHIDVIKKLKEGLKKFSPLVIQGDTSSHDRFWIERNFGIDNSKRLLIGSLTAMGLGFDFVKANRAIFVEFDWVPGVNEQASDRIDRIGQKRDILVQYLVFENSIDKRVMESNFRKKKILNSL